MCHWTSLATQTVKNLPAMKENQVQSLGQEDSLEKGMAIHSSSGILLPGEFHGQSSLVGYSSWGRKRVRHNLATKQQ